MWKYLEGVWKDKYILISLVKSDLRLKYKKSIIGVFWSVLTPLGLVAIIGMVYSVVFGIKPVDFIPALFAGLNPWLFLSGCADSGTMAFIGAEGYLKQTTVSPQIFPIRSVLVNFINLLYGICAFLIIYIFLKPEAFNWQMLYIIPGLIIIFLFAISSANISAIINLEIRDFQPFQSLIYQGLFYATPIIFPPKLLKEKGFEYLYKMNPFYYLIEIIKTPLLGNEPPMLDIYMISIVITIIFLVFSIYLIMSNKSKIVFKL